MPSQYSQWFFIVTRYAIQNNVLTIKNVRPDRDSGMYQLAATNSKGIAYSTAQLRVLCKYLGPISRRDLSLFWGLSLRLWS